MSPAKPTRKPTKMSDDSSIKRFKEEQAAKLQKRMEKKKQEQEAEEKRLAQEEDRKKAEAAAKEQRDREDAEKEKAAAQKKLKGARKSGGGRKVRPQTAEEKRKELRDGVLQAGECFCFKFLTLTFSMQILALLARSGANPAI